MEQPVLAVRLLQEMLLRERQQRQTFLGCATGPTRPIERVKEAHADFVFFQHKGDCLGLVDRRFSGTATLGIGRERLLQFVS